jgi:hypothetical protein
MPTVLSRGDMTWGVGRVTGGKAIEQSDAVTIVRSGEFQQYMTRK